MNKYEYKIEFNCKSNELQNIIDKITNIIKHELSQHIENIMPTFTVLEENELRYYVNISYDGLTVTQEEKEIPIDHHVNYACWDRSGYGGVYAYSNKSMEHAEELARKCFKQGAGCVN